MYYTVYKTTNMNNNMIYIGCHITKNPYDEYIGSGTRFQNAVKKHGKASFRKEVLHIFDNFHDMIDKEIEYVDEDFIRRPDTYNIVLGGYGWCTKGTVIILEEGKWIRIPKEEYDPSIHITPTTDSVKVKMKSTGEHVRINVREYRHNKHLYETHSSGKVSVYDIEQKCTKSIQKKDFDATKHKPVLGGIVAIVNGKSQYVTKDEFINEQLRGVHKGKVTVYDAIKEVRRHVTVEEYYANKDIYSTSGHGKITVFDEIQQKTVKVAKTDFNRDIHKATTHGQRTVWCLTTKKFINIEKTQFDRSLHALASDKHIVCTDENANVVFDYFGTKKDFVAMYGETLYNIAIKNTKNWQPFQKHKFEKFCGCSFEVKKWR